MNRERASILAPDAVELLDRPVSRGVELAVRLA
jgi:hypothetical protein